MKIPIYHIDKLSEFNCELGHNINEQDFDHFAHDLLYYCLLDSNNEEEVISIVCAKGTIELNSIQMETLHIIVNRFNISCRIYGNVYPLSFRIRIKEQDGLCDFHHWKSLSGEINSRQESLIKS